MRQQRNKLRAHGRQLGDSRQDNAEQSIEHLVQETAYEQWHRMLFARFLAENGLLIYEDGVTPLSIQDCFEMAEDESGVNGWELAGRYAPEQTDQENAEYKETDIPAAGTFEQWPKNLSELKMLDPCCGSGHFLVATLLMLVPMRMKAEGLSADEAIARVLSENIHGLELDQRCVEIAAFAVALEAWRYPESSGYRSLPSLNIAWVGQSIKAKKEDWLSLAGDDEHLYYGMEALYNTFKDAPLLGSLIDPSKSIAKNLLSDGFADLQPLLNQALQQFEVVENQEAAIAAKGLTLAVDLLNQKYEWIATNVPYLSRGKQCEALQNFTERHYGNAKGDIANVFLERCLELNSNGGITQMVMPQNWLFLGSYKKQREHLLKEVTWNLLARLGAGAFDAISGEVVNAILLSLTKAIPNNRHLLTGIDASAPKTVQEKVDILKSGQLSVASQKLQLENPDTRVTFGNTKGDLLSEFAETAGGQCTFDSLRFIFKFWECTKIDGKFWIYSQTPISETHNYSGRTNIIKWEDGVGEIYFLVEEMRKAGYTSGIWKAGTQVWGKHGVFVGLMGSLNVSLYSGTSFDNNSAVLIPKIESNLSALWAYCSSPQFNLDVRQLDQSLKVTNSTLKKVPFDLDYWTQVAQEKYPNGLPKPYSDDPTQWIFHGHPEPAEAPLQVAVARLLGYQWPAESDKDMELSDQARAWLAQCESLASFVDDDGIVCLSPVRGEKAADERLEALLMAAFGEQWNASLRNKLLTDVQCSGKTLGFWLKEKFFEQHCKVFQNRPFIWHIWDGLPDGFNVLVNYHQLDRQKLERLIYTYLVGDWIRTQDNGVKEGVDGAILRLQAAQILKIRLEAILEGEAPYDIFVRWKSLAEQPLGWNPDINDGVRMNIRPFMSVPDVGKKEAGILRSKPNIKWTKDRGNDVASAPWYKLGLQYNESEGSRINDHHLTLAEKKATRDA
jgi:N-6 DNA Methylase